MSKFVVFIRKIWYKLIVDIKLYNFWNKEVVILSRKNEDNTIGIVFFVTLLAIVAAFFIIYWAIIAIILIVSLIVVGIANMYRKRNLIFSKKLTN